MFDSFGLGLIKTIKPSMKVAITPSKLSSQDITSANKFTQVLEKNINGLIFSRIANTLMVHLPVEVG